MSRASSRCGRTSTAGSSAAEAARLALAEEWPSRSGAPAPVADARSSAAALDRFDEAGAQQALDRLLATLTLDVVLRDVLHAVPARARRALGAGRGVRRAGALREQPLRGRLMALARGHGTAAADRGRLLACVEGERHDLPLVGVRSRAARARLADQLPRGRHARRLPRRDHARAARPDAVVDLRHRRRRLRPDRDAGSARSRSTPPSTSRARPPTRRSHAGRTATLLSGDVVPPPRRSRRSVAEPGGCGVERAAPRWSTSERETDAGAVESRQWITLPRALVAADEHGARELGPPVPRRGGPVLARPRASATAGGRRRPRPRGDRAAASFRPSRGSRRERPDVECRYAIRGGAARRPSGRIARRRPAPGRRARAGRRRLLPSARRDASRRRSLRRGLYTALQARAHRAVGRRFFEAARPRGGAS